MLPTAYDVMSLLTRKLENYYGDSHQKKKKTAMGKILQGTLYGNLNLNLNMNFNLIDLKCFYFKSVNFRYYFKFNNFKLSKSFVNIIR